MSAPPTTAYRFTHRRAVWISLLVLLFLLAVLGLSPGRKHTGLQDSLQSLGHFGFFAVLAIAVTVAARHFDFAGLAQRAPWLTRYGVPYLLGLSSTLVVGGLLEFGQKFVPLREPSWNDLLFDVSGGVAGVSLLIAWDQRRPRSVTRIALALLSSVLFVSAVGFGSWPFIHCAIDYWQRNSYYPGLLAWDQPWAARFLSYDDCVDVKVGQPPEEWPRESRAPVAKFVIRPDEPYPGFGIKEPYPDWSNHSVFAFELLNPTTASLELGIRIQDFQHDEDYYDRFNRVLKLRPGFQTVRIPVDEIAAGPRHRRLDLDHVDRIKLFLIRPSRLTTLFVGGMRLE